MADGLKEAVELVRAAVDRRSDDLISEFRIKESAQLDDAIAEVLAALSAAEAEITEVNELLTKQNGLVRKIAAERDAAEARERVKDEALTEAGSVIGELLFVYGAMEDGDSEIPREILRAKAAEAMIRKAITPEPPMLSDQNEDKSLGEKLFDAERERGRHEYKWLNWEDYAPTFQTRYELIALAFAASLTHDETAQALIVAARQEGRQSSGDRVKALEDELPKSIVMPNGDVLTREYETWGRGVTVKDLQGKYSTNEEDWELVETYGLDALVRAMITSLLSPQAAPVEQGEG